MRPTNKQVNESIQLECKIKENLDEVRKSFEKWKINFFQTQWILKTTQNYATIVYNLILANGWK